MPEESVAGPKMLRLFQKAMALYDQRKHYFRPELNQQFSLITISNPKTMSQTNV